MEFFICTCSDPDGSGDVILDGVNLGNNMDQLGNPNIKQCERGLHSVSLDCHEGKQCDPDEVDVEIKNTDPIDPMVISFSCAS